MTAAQPISVREGVRFEQEIGRQLAINAEFTDESGRTWPLAKDLGPMPTILVFAYYRCPNLCTLVLNGLTQTLRAIPEVLGRDYRILTVSIDPSERPSLALEKKHSYLARLGDLSAPEDSWRFLTGKEFDIHRLAESAGFHFYRDPMSGEYAHPSGFLVISPSGTISKYFFGIQFDPGQLHEALQNAVAEKRGTWVDEVLLYCFHYDPKLSRHGRVIMRTIRLAGAAGAIATLGLLAYLFNYGNKEDLA
jgi:protein SCO1/2